MRPVSRTPFAFDYGSVQLGRPLQNRHFIIPERGVFIRNFLKFSRVATFFGVSVNVPLAVGEIRPLLAFRSLLFYRLFPGTFGQPQDFGKVHAACD